MNGTRKQNSLYARRASHAGSWYEDNPRSLSSAMDKFFGNVALPPLHIQQLIAVVGPHAGLSYCGDTSAYGYSILRDYLLSPAGASVKRIFMLGPSHHKWMEGVEVGVHATTYETPLGSIPIDNDMCSNILQGCKTLKVSCDALDQHTDEEEHSLELHLPFIASILCNDKYRAMQPSLSNIKLVPIIVGGNAEQHSDEKMAGVLRPYLGHPENIFVISTDFCHWGSRFRYVHHFEESKYPQIGDAIEAMDRAAIAQLEKKDVKGWYSYLSSTKNTICGRRPVSMLFQGVAGQASAKVQFLHYSQSNRVQTKSDSSVSYASGIVYV